MREPVMVPLEKRLYLRCFYDGGIQARICDNLEASIPDWKVRERGMLLAEKRGWIKRIKHLDNYEATLTPLGIAMAHLLQ
jgi:hypothetical protein